MPTLTTNHLAIEKQLATGGAFIRCPWCNGKNRDSGEYIGGRQPGDPLCCDKFAEAIFQIITQVVDGQAKYPERVRQAAEMTERMNLLFIERQVHELFRAASEDRALRSKGEIAASLVNKVLWCPYCVVDGQRVGNRFGNPELCCFDLGEAVAGILARMEIQRQMDNAARVTENADRLKECGVTVH